MERFRGITIGFLIVLAIVNTWIDIRNYKTSKILDMETAQYDSFKLVLSEAMKATDAATTDQPASALQQNDTYRANMSLERAMGLIMGLRTDMAREGMDIYPIFVALGQSESPIPYLDTDPMDKTQKTMTANSRTLHDLYSVLSSTSFSDAGINKLRTAVQELDGKYPGFPSYSSLQ